MFEALEDVTSVTVAPWLETGERPLGVTCKLLERAGNAVFAAGNTPLPPFNVGPPDVAN